MPRRVASLLPDDIKKDNESGIWYFDITDEEEAKQLKSESAKRFVPIHSRLIELGFLNYVDDTRNAIVHKPTVGGYDTRLLHDLSSVSHQVLIGGALVGCIVWGLVAKKPAFLRV